MKKEGTIFRVLETSQARDAWAARNKAGSQGGK